MSSAPELLYLHPEGHLNDYVVPVGALACLNAVPWPKLGRFAFEVRDEEIRRARVVALDLNWAVGLPGFSRLVQHVRATNPSATLIVGGISAGLWAARLLAELPIDYVIRGDSERAFAELVEGVLSDGDPSRIPNVVSRDVPEPILARMTRADFDATDSVTDGWFPTLERARSLEAEAFSHACTVSVTRGCAMRCGACYGSFARSFGPGHLTRSTQSVVRQVEAARDSGAPRLRLFLGKPSPKRLAELCRALAESGPHPFPSEVGLFCCTPPAREDARCLAAAFPRSVALSATHPAEHEPALSKEQVAAEWRAWCELAEQARGAANLGLDLWCHDSGLLARARQELAGSPAVRATWAGAWELTRPTDAGAPADFDVVNEAVSPLWTCSAARLLSPALASVLRVYAWLDDLDADPSSIPPPAGPLALARAALDLGWQRHRLPALPTLGFAVVRLPRAALLGFADGLAHVEPQSLSAARPTWLARSHRHDGVELGAGIELARDDSIVCLVPSLAPDVELDEAWLRAVAAAGLPALDVAHAEGPATVRVRIGNHQAHWVIAADDGTTLAELRRASGFFRPSPAR